MKTVFLILVLGLLVWGMPIQAAVWHVNHANTGGPHDGLSWDTAFVTIQDGVDAAAQHPGDEVWVASGVYGEARNVISGALVLRQGVSVYGGFLGLETAREARDGDRYPTVIDAARARGGRPAFHAVIGAEGAVLDGFRIRGGMADGAPATERHGGGLLAVGISMTVNRCIFSDNGAVGDGGALYSREATLIVRGCEFVRNEAVSGAAIRAQSGTITLENCLFIGNRASANGGALSLNHASGDMANCVLRTNTAVGAGGATELVGGNVRFRNCSMTGNVAGGAGGGVVNRGAAAELVNCILYDDAPGEIVVEAHDGHPGSANVHHSIVKGGFSGTGNRDVNPGFVDAASGDLRLREDSPALDMGVSLQAPAWDIANVVRPQRSGVDIGAYEMPPVVYVDKNLSISGNGTSWAKAFTRVQPAIDTAAALGGGQVWIKGGVYEEDRSETSVAGALTLRSRVQVYGGFAGGETASADRPMDGTPSVISGVRARNGEMARHVVEIVNCSDVTLDGLTISGGGASGPGANDPNGGGLYVAGSRGAVNRCVITQNIAQAKGGGAYVADSILSWDRCLFLANASPAGGGLFHVASRVQLDTCCFIDNWAGSAHSIQGVTSHAALLNSTLASSQDSTAPELVNQEATTVIVNSIVWSSASPALSGAGFDARHSNIRGFSGGTEVMDADPLFVDIEALDVHLGAASPCIDKGDALYAARPDWEGRARPQRRGTDLGAYEFPGNVVYVDERSSALVKTGASWATALTGVQEGIEKAYATGGEVWVAQGFYYWNGAQPDAGAFVLRPGVDVYGGFSGRETARDQRNVSRHATVLYGVNPGSGTAATHVITGANDTILDGLYIQGGDARGKSAPSGGGLYVWHMSMTLRDCVFSNNKASRGGALSADSSNINLSRCVFENNMATQTGGGVGIRWSNLRAIDCVFRGCEASDGGGIWSENSEIAFRKCFFEGNRAQGAGFLGGGAIGASTGTDLLAIACEFTGNIAPAGGVLACEEMALFMANCIAYDNEAGTAGGVLYSMGFVSGTLGEPRILGCTFYGNKGLMGSAYYSTNGPLPLSENTIVWGNGPDVVVGDAPFRYSIVQQSEPGPGNLNESPLFVDPSNGDFRILEDSPARDSAARADELTGTVPREATSVDIRNVPKPQGSGPDMGAYEFAESDSDGDGIFDEMEGDEDPDQDGIANYLDFDSDNDGLDDRLERSLGLDPYDASDADADPDSDGLSTRDEALLHHTNPFVADTDGGGVKDGDEIRLGRNPLSPHDDNPYDVNVDGQVDAIDVQLVINGALRISVPFHTDVNLDGATDALDVQMVINAALRLM